MATNQNVLIPLKLDAFVFNDAVCNGGEGKAKIAPISQPNYSFLRLKESYLQSDILYDVDLHNAAPAIDNSRITDLGTRQSRENRRGVYLHWTIPRIYRSGTAVTSEGDGDKKGLPSFPEPPTRWLVVRHIHNLEEVQPPAAAKALTPVMGWIVESDRCRTLDGARRNGELVDKINVLPADMDLQVDVSPFVSPSDSVDNGDVLDKQAEIFIGDKTDALNWKETVPLDGTEDKIKKRVDLQLMGSSNELFADFQPHCSNVFSIVDNFYYGTQEKKPMYATDVRASYSVIGWNSRAPKDIAKPRKKRSDELIPGKDEKPYQTREQRFRELNMVIKGFQEELEPMTKYPEKIFNWFKHSHGLPEDPNTRSLCHGAMYDVHWNLNTAPVTVLADHYASLLCNSQPVSVGTTPMDALMAYAGAHEKIDGGVQKDIEAALKRLETILLSRDDGVEAHAQAADMLYNWNYLRLDGGDQFHATASGDQTGKHQKPTLPDPKKEELMKRNKICRFRDGAQRQLKKQRWAVFSEWWLSVTQAKKDTDILETLKPILKSIKDLGDKIKWCNDQLGLDPTHKTPTDKVQDFEPGVHPPYHQQRDPTLLIGGVRSGWELDYLLALLVRLDCQLPPEVSESLPDEAINGWGEFFTGVVTAKLPKDLQQSAQSLLREFVLMHARRDPEKDDGHPKKPGMLTERGLFRPVNARLVHDLEVTMYGDEPPRPPLIPEIPLFHDLLGLDTKGEKVWRDYWNETQPWFPLFLEWEVEYTHIQHEDWELSESKWWHSEGARLHYGIKKDIDLADKYDPEQLDSPPKDRRRLAGRVLILPQPSFSLEAKIAQLLANTLPSKLKEYLPDDDLEYLDKNLQQLQFLSAPLGGFNSHMLTVEQGNHVKPSVRDPVKATLSFLPEAFRAEAGLNAESMPAMDIETDVTPYGKFRKSIAGKKGPASFKPVTHGQFRLTRLNIIDRFGQAIHAIDPQPVPEGDKTPTVAPCISDWYAPGAKQGKGNVTIPNVVERNINEKDPKCEYVQVPPQINQPARLNAVWAMPVEEKKKAAPPVPPPSQVGDPNPEPETPFWRAANDWDQPIWGWVVVNYANFGLQFFLPSGAFYREVRRAGPTGALASPEWLPFQKPDNPDGADRGGSADGGVAARQLARLVETLAACPEYLTGFIATLNAATTSSGNAAPSAYAEFRSALIGKPLALVNMGWSLELAGPALVGYLNNDGVVPKRLYLDTAKKGIPGPGYEKNTEYDRKHYRFPIKLGDRERGFDGLVGYFKVKPTTSTKPGDALELDTMYSHFSPGTQAYERELHKFPPSPTSTISPSKLAAVAEEHIVAISSDTYPRLAPYYISPTNAEGSIVVSLEEYDAITNEQLNVFGAVVDPFAPVHAYSGILPVRELALPTWTWQGSMDRLSAFFHLGPVLVTGDVPDFETKRELVQGNLPPKVVDRKESKEGKPRENGVGLPGGALEQWTWLQPYMPELMVAATADGGGPGTGPGDGGEKEKRKEKFMPLAIDPVDERAKLERGPYTVLTGYLQMAAGAVEQK
jgi:hypothetical protein